MFDWLRTIDEIAIFHRGMLETLIRPYYVTLINAAYAKWLSERKVFFKRQAFTRSPIQIQINNKTIIEVGSRRI